MRTSRIAESQPSPKLLEQRWLFVAARAFTRSIRKALDAHGEVVWSAPKKLRPGDLALLYEMGKPDGPGDPSGRKEAGWILRARSRPRPDPTWSYVADYDGAPLSHPLALREMRRAFSDGSSLNLKGTRHRRLSVDQWNALLRLIEERNKGFIATLQCHSDRLFHSSGDAGADDLPFPEDGGRVWRTERWLRDAVRDLIDEERWATRPDPSNREFGQPSEHGYYIPELNRYIDDILLLGDRHLLVVEYEREALGAPQHGVAQVTANRDALRELRRLRAWQIDGIVIAGVIVRSERELARCHGIECMEAHRESKGTAVLTSIGPAGPASKLRAVRRERRWSRLRYRRWRAHHRDERSEG
jgi:hypothetical protein